MKRQLEFVKPKFESEARKNAMPFVTMQLGESLREKHKDDDVSLAGPNEVKIVAKSEASKAQFKEEILTFDERGLLDARQRSSRRPARKASSRRSSSSARQASSPTNRSRRRSARTSPS